MALGKNCGSNVTRINEGFVLGLVRCTSFGRKRVVLLNDMQIDSTVSTPTKKHCNENSLFCSDKSPLESLPQDILIKILCGVEHDDLKRLFKVSKFIREATLIAKKCHFEYSTPRKTLGFQNSINLEDLSESNEVEAPNAPRQSRIPRSRLCGKKLADISVALFASPDEGRCPIETQI